MEREIQILRPPELLMLLFAQERFRHILSIRRRYLLHSFIDEHDLSRHLDSGVGSDGIVEVGSSVIDHYREQGISDRIIGDHGVIEHIVMG